MCTARTLARRAAPWLATLPLLPVPQPALAPAAEPPPRSKSAITLGDLALLSDEIHLGRVLRVVDVRNPGPYPALAPGAAPGSERALILGTVRAWLRAPVYPFAEVQVLRTLKGERPNHTVHCLATGTWSCDTTDAIEGEVALFFLEHNPCFDELSPAFQDNLRCLTGGEPAFSIAHSGTGRMPLRMFEGHELVTLEWSPFFQPDLVETIPGPEPDTHWTRSTPLHPLEDFIRQTLVERHVPMPLHPVSELPATAALYRRPGGRYAHRLEKNEAPILVAAFWDNGDRYWSKDLLRGGPPYFTARPDPWGPSRGGAVSEVREHGEWLLGHDLEAAASEAWIGLRFNGAVESLPGPVPGVGDRSRAPEDLRAYERLWSELYRDLIESLPESGVPTDIEHWTFR